MNKAIFWVECLNKMIIQLIICDIICIYTKNTILKDMHVDKTNAQELLVTLSWQVKYAWVE